MAEPRKVVRKGGAGLVYDVVGEVGEYLWVRYHSNPPNTVVSEAFERYDPLPYPVGTRLRFNYRTSIYEYLGLYGSGDDPVRHALRFEEDGRVYDTSMLELYSQVD